MARRKGFWCGDVAEIAGCIGRRHRRATVGDSQIYRQAKRSTQQPLDAVVFAAETPDGAKTYWHKLESVLPFGVICKLPPIFTYDIHSSIIH